MASRETEPTCVLEGQINKNLIEIQNWIDRYEGVIGALIEETAESRELLVKEGIEIDISIDLQTDVFMGMVEARDVLIESQKKECLGLNGCDVDCRRRLGILAALEAMGDAEG